MKVIELTKGQVAIVDDEDFDRLAQWRWHFHSNGYAARCQRYGPRKENKHRTVLMHREIMQTPSDMDTDHVNGNKLDNRRCNLRVATQAQNRWNADFSKNLLGRGVQPTKNGKKFSARITTNGVGRGLGVYDTVEEARAAYNRAACELHGTFARLN